MKALAAFLAITACAAAGPVEFGLAEVQRAVEARGLSPARFRFRTAVTTDGADSFRVAPGMVTGGSLRGIMYGLLEAADQIRETGRIRITTGTPAEGIRGVRLRLPEGDFNWPEYFRMLARNRFNRFNLLVDGIDQSAVCSISGSAAEYGIDFTLSLSRDEAALSQALAACPAIRSVQIENGEAVLKAVREAGRRVTLELRGEAMIAEARAAGVPVRISAKWPGSNQHPVLWEVEGPRRPWADPEHVRRVMPALAAGEGFEIGGPPADRFWLFYLLWGRIGYDPKVSERVWISELEARFGAAARDVLDAYRAASAAAPDPAAIERSCRRVRQRLGPSHAEWDAAEAELLAVAREQGAPPPSTKTLPQDGSVTSARVSPAAARPTARVRETPYTYP